MNREIKFRAFIPDANLMLDRVTVYADGTIGVSSDDLSLAVNQAGLVLEDDCIRDKKGNHLVNILSGEDWYWIEDGHYNVLEFTGRKDKAGKDIYEGDRVRWKTYEYDFDKPEGEERHEVVKESEIEFRGKGFWVKDECFGWEGEGLWDWDEIEVIGNIYENKL